MWDIGRFKFMLLIIQIVDLNFNPIKFKCQLNFDLMGRFYQLYSKIVPTLDYY